MLLSRETCVNPACCSRQGHIYVCSACYRRQGHMFPLACCQRQGHTCPLTVLHTYMSGLLASAHRDTSPSRVLPSTVTHVSFQHAAVDKDYGICHFIGLQSTTIRMPLQLVPPTVTHVSFQRTAVDSDTYVHSACCS